VDKELEKMWMGMVMDCFQVKFSYLSRRADELIAFSLYSRLTLQNGIFDV
jgi:hypothetical protein